MMVITIFGFTKITSGNHVEKNSQIVLDSIDSLCHHERGIEKDLLFYLLE